MTYETLTHCQNLGLIFNTVGDAKSRLPTENVAFICQARNIPKKVFLAFTAFANSTNNKPLNVYIDNLFSQVEQNRTDEQQKIMDNHYRNFFESENCKVHFSKDLEERIYYPSAPISIFRCLKKINFSEFKSLLPIHKRVDPNFQLTAFEIFHAAFELLFLDFISKSNEIILIGHGSVAVISLHKKLANKPLTAIVMPSFFSEQSIEEYIHNSNQLVNDKLFRK